MPSPASPRPLPVAPGPSPAPGGLRRGAWVGLVAVGAAVVVGACGGDDGGGSRVATPAAPGAGTQVTLTATEMAYDPDEVAVPAGDVTVTLDNAGFLLHDVRIEGLAHVLVEAQPGTEASGSWTLPAGTYTFFCSIPGHRVAGMEGRITVG